MTAESNPFDVLGIELKNFYDVVARSVSGVVENRDGWKDISLRVKSELSPEEQAAILQLSNYADNDNDFSRFAGVSRGEGSPCGLGFYMSIATYALKKHEERLNL
ncbi:hypothetical protein HN903_03415 [archaeon]|jgi:hypothetical protein|nr:hypothetical protein [archaeon]MBT7128778.1 hypothetical protein [archaeon]